MRRIQTALLIAVAIIIGILSSVHAYWIFLRFASPHTYLEARTETPIIRPGDSIVVRYVFVRHRYCSTTLNLFVVSRPDNFVVWRERVPGGAALLGRREVIHTYPLPHDIRPGQYMFRTITVAECPDGLHVTNAPDIPFEVRD